MLEILMDTDIHQQSHNSNRRCNSNMWSNNDMGGNSVDICMDTDIHQQGP